MCGVTASVDVSQVAIAAKMAVFCLEGFVAKPTLGQLDGCKKADLFAIAKHYGFSVSSSLVKAELRAAVTDGLVQSGVLSLTDLPAGAAARQSASVAEDVATPPDAADTLGVKPGGDKQFTLPRYYPLSVESSPTSREDARLKVRLARLHLEREERETRAPAQEGVGAKEVGGRNRH